MPRDKSTEPLELPDITGEELSFVQEWLVDGNATRAFKVAWPHAEEWTDNAVRVEACRRLQKPNVRLTIDACRRYMGAKAECTLEQHLNELDRLKNVSEVTGNLGAAVNAEVNRGKASGLYVDRVRQEPVDPAGLAEAIKDVAPELAKQLREIGTVH